MSSSRLDCPLCDAAFIKPSSFLKHAKSQHNVAISSAGLEPEVIDIEDDEVNHQRASNANHHTVVRPGCGVKNVNQAVVKLHTMESNLLAKLRSPLKSNSHSATNTTHRTAIGLQSAVKKFHQSVVKSQSASNTNHHTAVRPGSGIKNVHKAVVKSHNMFNANRQNVAKSRSDQHSASNTTHHTAVGLPCDVKKFYQAAVKSPSASNTNHHTAVRPQSALKNVHQSAVKQLKVEQCITLDVPVLEPVSPAVKPPVLGTPNRTAVIKPRLITPTRPQNTSVGIISVRSWATEPVTPVEPQIKPPVLAKPSSVRPAAAAAALKVKSWISPPARRARKSPKTPKAIRPRKIGFVPILPKPAPAVFQLNNGTVAIPIQVKTMSFPVLNSVEKLYHCSQCNGGPYKTEVSLRTHITMVHGWSSSIACSHCSVTLPSPWHLKVHLERVHGSANKYECDWCGEEFQTQEKVNHHEMRECGRRKSVLKSK